MTGRRKSKRLRKMQPEEETQEVQIKNVGATLSPRSRPRRSKRVRRLPPTHVSQDTEEESDVEGIEDQDEGGSGDEIPDYLIRDSEDEEIDGLRDAFEREQARKARRNRWMEEEKEDGLGRMEIRKRYQERENRDARIVEEADLSSDDDDHSLQQLDSDSDSLDEFDLDPEERERDKEMRDLRKGGGKKKSNVFIKRGPRRFKRPVRLGPRGLDEDRDESEEKFSNDPEENRNRFILRDWLRKTVKGKKEDHLKRLSQLLGLAHWDLQLVTEWEDGKGFFVPYQNNGGRKLLATYLANRWRGGLSAEQKDRDACVSKTPSGKKSTAKRQARWRANAPKRDLLYFASVVSKTQRLGTSLSKTFSDQKLKQLIYPGQYGPLNGNVSMRRNHFSDPTSPIYKLLKNRRNPKSCYELLVISCVDRAAREQGEAWIMIYAEEWNRCQEERFIITETVALVDDSGELEKRARNYNARKGVWLFQHLEDKSPRPGVPANRLDLFKLPYGLKNSGIKKRELPRKGEVSNIW